MKTETLKLLKNKLGSGKLGAHDAYDLLDYMSELESQLKEAKELLSKANPMWKENCAKWADWHGRLKRLI